MDAVESSSSSDELELTINTAYASKYDKWRSKEEYQKLKDKYGDVDLDNTGNDSFDSSSSEDEDAMAFTPAMEKDFLRTLAALKSQDPKIYDPAVQFFKETQPQTSEEGEQEDENDQRKDKPMFLKDYEREVILQRGGKFSDDNSESEQEEAAKPAGYYEEQEAIRQSFKNVYVPGDDDNLLSLRIKSKEELVKEEEGYLEWLKGQKQTLSRDKSIAAELTPLRKFWTDPALDDGERFLRDYLLNKEYLEEDEGIPSYEEIVRQLEDDEKELDKQEQFEKKYNFRFEEPDAEIIKSYPRTIPETLRNKDSRRVKARLAVRERKRMEKEKRQEELKRLKNLKKREIVEKIEKLKDVTGNTAVGFTEEDVEGAFNEREYDEMMRKVFDDEYYSHDVDRQKPVFTDDEDEEGENWDEWQPTAQNQEESEYIEQQTEDYEPHCDDPNFIMDADYDPTQQRVKTKKKKKKGKGKPDKSVMQEDLTGRKRRRSKFAEAIEKPKPLFDADKKSFEEYFDEYYQLDYEDVIDGMPVRFKYRKVVPNDFGLSVDEVLSVPDKELNTWVSVKKMSQYRECVEEDRDVLAYQRKAKNPQKKLNILMSLRQPDASDVVKSSATKSKKPAPETFTSKSCQRTATETDKKCATSATGSKVNKDKKRKSEDERIDGASSPADETCSVKHKKRKKDGVAVKSFDTATDITDSTSAQSTAGCKKKKKKKRRERDLPAISDDRLKAYGINPKKFKYFHQKKLLKEKR